MKLQADNRVGAGGEIQGSCAGRDHAPHAPCRWMQGVPSLCVLIKPGQAGWGRWYGDGPHSWAQEPRASHPPGRTNRGHRLREPEGAPQKPPNWEKIPDTGRAGLGPEDLGWRAPGGVECREGWRVEDLQQGCGCCQRKPLNQGQK